MILELTVACLLNAAHDYFLPVDPLYSILQVEGGRSGLAKPNYDRHGHVLSEDLGPFQVNTTWLPVFTVYWRQPSQAATYVRLRDDGCANAYAAAAILRYYLQQTGTMDAAVARYHTGPKGSPAEAAKYLSAYKYVLHTGHLPRRPK
ncbi:MAG: hypothetical protein M0006_15900 [Magnetospirillum sp.]|nr:hypothetical protein [Magnetospirillum sp.]